MTWPTTVPTFATGVGGVTVAKLNDVRDALSALGDSWASYTPALTATSVNPTMGASALAGRYRLAGKTVDIQIGMTIGAGFAGGTGAWRFSYPAGLVPIIANSAYLGGSSGRDVSVPTVFTFFALHVTSTTFALQRTDAQTAISGTAPFTWATGDLLSIQISGLEIT